MQPSPTRAHAFISGQVQGVGYRFSTLQEAQGLGLAGWVRNLSDRRVEAVFEGTAEAVEQMLHWCHEGPPAAHVRNVTVEYEAHQGLAGFEIRR